MARRARDAGSPSTRKTPAKKTKTTPAKKTQAKTATKAEPDKPDAAAPQPPGKAAKPDDPFGDRAWLTGKRSKGSSIPATPAYVLPESRHESVVELTVGELESMVSGAIDVALEDKRRGAPRGNRFWEARSSHGRKPKFPVGDKGAAKLEAACAEYFEWVEEHPLHEEVLVTFQGSATHDTVTKMRAMTLEGLCLFIDITPQTWREWRGRPASPDAPAAPGRPDLSGVIEWAETVIRTQKFEGAAAGFLNANIISRELGLADRTAATMEAGDSLKQLLTDIQSQPLFGRGR